MKGDEVDIVEVVVGRNQLTVKRIGIDLTSCLAIYANSLHNLAIKSQTHCII